VDSELRCNLNRLQSGVEVKIINPNSEMTCLHLKPSSTTYPKKYSNRFLFGKRNVIFSKSQPNTGSITIGVERSSGPEV